VGDNQLYPEFAYEADLSMHFHKTHFTLDIAGYYNFIQDFIFISPTGMETGQGLPVYQYRQSDARLFGGEAGIHFHPEFIHWLHMQSTFATVAGKQTLSEQFLPFIPADKFNLEIRAEKEQLLFLHDSYVKAGFHYAFAQQNPAPEEEATDAYGLFDLQAGGEIKWQKQIILLNIGINNLFDVQYVDHLSTLKEAGFFNPGRNITFTMKIPFGSDL
jgi:iron complex outermembrane receptor protein